MGRKPACRAAVSMAPPPARALLVLAAALTGKAHDDETTPACAAMAARLVSASPCSLLVCSRAGSIGMEWLTLTGILLVFAVIVAVPAPALAAWVDYPSGVPCGETFPVEQCDPGDAAANSACMDMCHYGGCRRGGQCVSLGFARGRGCHCKF